MKEIIIIGAGTHGRDVAENLLHPEHRNTKRLIGFIDDDKSLKGKSIDGYPVLGGWEWLEARDISDFGFVCGLGLSGPRKSIAERASAYGARFANIVSPLAFLANDVKLGTGNVIGHSAVVCRGTVIGDHTIINYGSQVSHDNTIDDFVTINPSANLAGNIKIGEGSYIGIGASFIQGIKIGNWTTVGAGAVVIRDLPDNVTAVGVPAKVIKEGISLND